MQNYAQDLHFLWPANSELRADCLSQGILIGGGIIPFSGWPAPAGVSKNCGL